MFNIGDRVFFKRHNIGTCYIVEDIMLDNVTNQYLLEVKVDGESNSPVGWFFGNNFYKIKEENKMTFKVGDMVKIVRKVTEQNGWKNGWAPAMDESIGALATINFINEYGVSLNETPYKFPTNSLELFVAPKQTDRGIKYQYFNVDNNLCLAIRTSIVLDKTGNVEVSWAVTFKNPKDHFSKLAARAALSSVKSKTLYVEKGYTRDNIVLKILCDLVYNIQNIPHTYRPYIFELLSDYSHIVYMDGNFK